MRSAVQARLSLHKENQAVVKVFATAFFIYFPQFSRILAVNLNILSYFASRHTILRNFSGKF